MIVLIALGSGPDPDPQAQAGGFERGLRPLLAKYCMDCHDAETKKGGLDLSSLNAGLDRKEIFPPRESTHRSRLFSSGRAMGCDFGQLGQFLITAHLRIEEHLIQQMPCNLWHEQGQRKFNHATHDSYDKVPFIGFDVSDKPEKVVEACGFFRKSMFSVG